MMCGGTTEMKSPDDESNQMLTTVKDQFHEKAGTSGEGLNHGTLPDLIKIILVELLGYKTQIVAGTNYFMKIAVGDKVIHARVFQPLPHTGESAQVHSIEDKNHSPESELSYF